MKDRKFKVRPTQCQNKTGKTKRTFRPIRNQKEIKPMPLASGLIAMWKSWPVAAPDKVFRLGK